MTGSPRPSSAIELDNLAMRSTSQTQQPSDNSVDEFGARPFLSPPVTSPTDMVVGQASSASLGDVNRPPSRTLDEGAKRKHVVPDLVLLGDFIDDNQTTDNQNKDQTLSLDFSNPQRQLDEFGALPFSPRRKVSESSSERDDRATDSLRDYSYEDFDAQSLEIRKDEEHIHRGLLDKEDSSEEDSDDDSDQHDHDDTSTRGALIQEEDLSDAELSGLNLRDPNPPVGNLIDMGDDDDPFGKAPFKASTASTSTPSVTVPVPKSRSELLSSCTLTPPVSPPMQVKPDPFIEAPFDPRSIQRQGSRTSSTSESSDVFSKAPFPSKKRPDTQQSTTGAHKPKSQRSNTDLSATGNPTPPLSPTDMDLFGKGAMKPHGNVKQGAADLFGAVPFEAVASKLTVTGDKPSGVQPQHHKHEAGM